MFAGTRCQQRKLLPKLQSIKDALPYGYRIETGGAIDERQRPMPRAAVFPMMAVVMLAVLDDPASELLAAGVMVFATAPLGIISATGRIVDIQPPVCLCGLAQSGLRLLA